MSLSRFLSPVNSATNMSDVCNFKSFYISEELVFEILKRLPVKTLIRCMSVCKAWCFLVKTPDFIFTHLNLQTAISNSSEGRRYLIYKVRPTRYLVLCDNDELELYQEWNLPQKYGGIGFSNGVFCLDDFNTFGFVFMNMALNKSVKFEKPKFQWKHNMFFTYGFGFDPSTNDYKLVYFTYFTYHSELCDVFVYSLNAGCWRVVNHETLSLGMGDASLEFDAVHLNGVVYWIVYTGYQDTKCPCSILAFDMVEECFWEIPLPEDIEFDLDVCNSTRLMTVPMSSGTEYLAFLHDDQTVINVWVLEEYGSWRVMLYLNRNAGYKKLINVRTNGGIVVELEDGRVVSLNPHNKTGTLLPDNILDCVAVYVESLVLL